MRFGSFDGAAADALASVPGRGIHLSRVTDQSSVANKLLLGLEPNFFRQIAPLLRRVPLRMRQTLVEPNLPVREVYFIERGTASVISRSTQHRPIEVSMIGCMGLAGLPAVLGTNRSPFRCVVQIPGTAVQMRAEDLRCAMEEIPRFRQLMMNYVQARMVQQAQITVCNARHQIKQRVARWLLMGLDRLEGNVIPVTHELLGRMLGIRRASVTVAVSEMAATGMLCCGRGQLTIVDLPKLEQCACDCHDFIKREYDRLIGHSPGIRGEFCPAARQVDS
jgi:CRP-like cAMP-binding protein